VSLFGSMVAHTSKEIYSGESRFETYRFDAPSPGEFSRICICFSSTHVQRHEHMLNYCKVELQKVDNPTR
jgi:hypothetical protein